MKTALYRPRLLATDLSILNHGQVTRTTPELAPSSPNFHTTQTGGLQATTGVSLTNWFLHSPSKEIMQETNEMLTYIRDLLVPLGPVFNGHENGKTPRSHVGPLRGKTWSSGTFTLH
ncbi:hypothetical protein TNCV_2671111 [Trichonephila clavipes]|nr:hypothetical protein TNCV_2671111 [Trichonephila clavipes]